MKKVNDFMNPDGLITQEELAKLKPSKPIGFWWREYISTLILALIISSILIAVTSPLIIIFGYDFLFAIHILLLLAPFFFAFAVGGNIGPVFKDKYFGIHYYKKRMVIWNRLWTRVWLYKTYLKEKNKYEKQG